MSKNSQILLLPLSLFIPSTWKQQDQWMGRKSGAETHRESFCWDQLSIAPGFTRRLFLLKLISPAPPRLGRGEGFLSIPEQPEALTIYCHYRFLGSFCKGWGARSSVVALCHLWSLHTAPKMPLEISIQYSPSLPVLNCYAALMGSVEHSQWFLWVCRASLLLLPLTSGELLHIYSGVSNSRIRPRDSTIT